MSIKELTEYQEKTFDSIKHIDNNGNEYWEARELQQILGYKEWIFFSKVITTLIPILEFTPKS